MADTRKHRGSAWAHDAGEHLRVRRLYHSGDTWRWGEHAKRLHLELRLARQGVLGIPTGRRRRAFAVLGLNTEGPVRQLGPACQAISMCTEDKPGHIVG